MENVIKLMKDYSSQKVTAMGERWNKEMFDWCISTVDARKVDKIGNSFLNYFVNVRHIKEHTCISCYDSKTRLKLIIGAINTKSKDARRRKFIKIWDDYKCGFLARYEIMSALKDMDEALINIVDYSDDWKDLGVKKEMHRKLKLEMVE